MVDLQRSRVVVDAPQHSGLTGPLDYTSEHPLAPGSLVRVPLGRRDVAGLVWPAAQPDSTPGAMLAAPALPITLRAVQQVVRSLPPLSPRWCELVSFTAAYYQRSIGEVALSVLPPELRKLDDAQLQRRIDRLRRALLPTRCRAGAAGAARRACGERRTGAGARPNSTRCAPRSRVPSCCCTAPPAAARPRSTCAPPSRCSPPGVRCWCWCPRSTSRRNSKRASPSVSAPRRRRAASSRCTAV